MFAGKKRLLDKPRQTSQVKSAKHHIDMGKLLYQLGAIALADAAANNHHALINRRILTQRNILKRSNLPHQTHISRLTYAAGNEDDDVRFFNGFNFGSAKRSEHAHDSLGIVFVHLASERNNGKRFARNSAIR